MTPPIPLNEAQARLLQDVVPLGSETIETAAACGRYLAEPLVARRTQPVADLSSMDGYAMRADDTGGPWQLVGESAAGHPFAGTLGRGEAVRISTGAHMPTDAGAILLQENACTDAGTVRVADPEGDRPTDRYIRRKGFDFTAGDTLLNGGTRIDAASLALAMAAGVWQLKVGGRPVVAIIDSGDELTAHADPARPDALPASNGPMLAAMCSELAARALVQPPVADSRRALRESLEAAAGADVIVTTGGASVGDHDHMRTALADWGATIDFWRVAIRPGKPLLVARKGGIIVLGLPGNPVSAFVTAHLFLLPLLRRMGGAGDPLPRFIDARLSGSLPVGGARQEFMRGVWAEGGVAAIAERDSSALHALANADVLIERPIGAPAALHGDSVRVLVLKNGGNA
ncbi:molybdopterin molybdenumtransferase MoeA [Tsuneonella suprasediminis]|uniref:Molybdopterin molybdenumtransferase n=1 Tax=Tsuneonella suprasediminis TaxID=2306996 RepID=A0A419R0S2_9SPHN|nr:molybdopterin molybdotransferase MoeA [Tsuneonella suprasediminis]RJX67092.1 molybdopterin molybdenumtransferase MoeA [Tsuneonella suprasediminis]